MSRAINSGFSSARAPGLDFLDSFRTLGDCGVEEPLKAPRSVNQSESVQFGPPRCQQLEVAPEASFRFKLLGR